MRMDTQTTKKLLRVRLALLRHNSKLSLSPLAEGNCWYCERFSRPLFSVLGKTGLHEAVTSESGRSSAHLKHSSLFSRPRLCRKTPSLARERAIFSPGKDGEAGDVGFIVDKAGCSQADNPVAFVQLLLR